MRLSPDGRKVLHKLQGCIADILGAKLNNDDYREAIRTITEMLVITNMSCDETSTKNNLVCLKGAKLDEEF